MAADTEIIGASNIDIHELMQFEQTPSAEDFLNVIRKITRGYGLHNAAYYSPTLPNRRVDDPFVVTTYTPEWVSHYTRSNYFAVDPAVTAGARSLLPLDWGRMDRSSRKVVKLYSESREAGVGLQGLTIPIRGAVNGVWGLFCVTTNDNDREWVGRRRHILSDLVLLGHFLHQKAVDLHNTGEAIDLNAITRRETEALAWTSEGKSVAEIASLMGISTETVKAHLDSARYKLGALSRVHAVARAIRYGLIR